MKVGGTRGGIVVLSIGGVLSKHVHHYQLGSRAAGHNNGRSVGDGGSFLPWSLEF